MTMLIIFIYFNPLPRKEGDAGSQSGCIRSGNFNPLPRKEGDGDCGRDCETYHDFNPLPRKEGDSKFR